MKATTRIGYFSAIAIGLAMPLTFSTQAQGKNPLGGTWQLVSTTNTDDKGVSKVGTFGKDPLGRVVYTDAGHYVSCSTASDLPKFENRLKATPDEYRQVVQKSNCSYGSYKVAPDGKSVTIKQEAGTFAFRNGWEETRKLEIKGDEMHYWTQATYGGKSELVYKRLK